MKLQTAKKKNYMSKKTQTNEEQSQQVTTEVEQHQQKTTMIWRHPHKIIDHRNTSFKNVSNSFSNTNHRHTDTSSSPDQTRQMEANHKKGTYDHLKEFQPTLRKSLAHEPTKSVSYGRKKKLQQILKKRTKQRTHSNSR